MSTPDQIERAMRPQDMPDVQVVSLEASNVKSLGSQAARWLADNPRHEVVSLTYAPAVRIEPSIGLAGPRNVTVERGLLVVRAA
jgi:hypothetical protein